MEGRDIKRKFDDIRFDVTKGTLEEVKAILDNYDKDYIEVDGFKEYFKPNPLEAACLNEAYKRETGENHPIFVKEQKKILDKIIETEGTTSEISVYKRLKNNLTGEGPGINILSKAYIKALEKTQYDMYKMTPEEIKLILDNYDQEIVLIDGANYHGRPNPLVAASLNDMYKKETGEDHSKFLEVQGQVLKELIDDKWEVKVGENPTIYEMLQNNLTGKDQGIEIGDHNHIVNRFHIILENLDTSSLEDITNLLDYYNGKPVLIEGIAYHPFNDPVCAAKLNAKYHELTGKNHPVFVEETPKVIEKLNNDKKELLKSGVFPREYFQKLEQIEADLGIDHVSKSTKKISRIKLLEKMKDLRMSVIKKETDEIIKTELDQRVDKKESDEIIK